MTRLLDSVSQDFSDTLETLSLCFNATFLSTIPLHGSLGCFPRLKDLELDTRLFWNSDPDTWKGDDREPHAQCLFHNLPTSLETLHVFTWANEEDFDLIETWFADITNVAKRYPKLRAVTVTCGRTSSMGRSLAGPMPHHSKHFREAQKMDIVHYVDKIGAAVPDFVSRWRRRW